MSLASRARGLLRRSAVTAPLLRLPERLTSLVVLLRAGAFDPGWYQLQRTGRDRAGGGRAGTLLLAAHYVWRGRRAGLGPHPLFEAEWAYPRDWRDSGPDPVARLLRGRPRRPISSHPLCDPQVWLAAHPDAARHRWGWFGHFLAATAGPQGAATPLPLPRWATRCTVPGLTVAGARELLTRQVLSWRADEARRRAPRVTGSHDTAREAELVARLAAAPLPDPRPGHPLVSVVLPVRDRADVVGAAVASVLAQTLTDWELLVVDDGSTDGTADAVRAAAAGDPRAVVVTGAGRGVSVARNLGAARARGRYVAWLDSDNTWQPHHLRTVVAAMEDGGWRAAYAAVEGTGRGRPGRWWSGRWWSGRWWSGRGPARRGSTGRGAAGRRYRSFDPGSSPAEQLPFLKVANHVDLNVLVLRRDLLTELGGFDESLRRTVDYDLVWRAAKITDLHHLPVIGVRYAEDERADRITVRERPSWREVVKNRHLIDWEALAAGAADREEDLLSVLVAAGPDWRGAWDTARSVFDDADAPAGPAPTGPGGAGSGVEGGPGGAGSGVEGGVEVVVTDDATPRGSAVVLSCLPLLDSRARLVRSPVRVHRALATNLALAASTGAEVALLEAGTQVWPGWRSVRGHLAAGALAAPVVLDADGVVASAGGMFTGGHALPADLLGGLPFEDAARLGEKMPVDTPPGAAVALRAADLLAVGGLDCLYVDGWELADLALRLGGGHPVHMDTRARARQPLPPVATAEQDAADRELFARRWGRRDHPAERVGAAWAEAGFEVRGWRPPVGAEPTGAEPVGAVGAGPGTGGTAAPGVPVPVLARRRHPPARQADGQEVPRLRWAVKIAAPTDRAALSWGDLHFAHAVAAALRRLGQDVVIDHRDALQRPTGRFDDVVLTIRGLRPVPPRADAPGQVRLLWVISHPELVGPEEVATYDHAFAASLTWGRGAAGAAAPDGLGVAGAAAPDGLGVAGAAAPDGLGAAGAVAPDGLGAAGAAVMVDRHGDPVEPLLQATDPARFHPGVAAPDTGEPVLFVGNSRGVYRPVVRALVGAGVEVGIYGGRWAEFLGAGAVRAEHVPNEQVAALYRAAGIVLNDHWDDMRAQGFVSNRLFDAAACAARVISDDIAGVGQLFGGLVRTYRSEAELLDLVRAGTDGFPDDTHRVAVAAGIARDHSFDARAARLLDAVRAARER